MCLQLSPECTNNVNNRPVWEVSFYRIFFLTKKRNNMQSIVMHVSTSNIRVQGGKTLLPPSDHCFLGTILLTQRCRKWSWEPLFPLD